MKYVVLMLLALLAVVGCGDSNTFTTADSAISSEHGIDVGISRDGNLKNDKHFYSETDVVRALSRVQASKVSVASGGQDDQGGDKKSNITRKIIYNAEINLVVEDLDAGEKQLKQLISQYGGQVASSDLRGQSGAQRSGRWKVRIPVDKFDAFKAAVEKIGNLERSSTNSSDVTEEFYDIEARLKNKTVEEKRLIQHLEKSTAKLSDILDVEKELSRVRGEIEQMQGRLNRLTNLTSLTTIDVTVREVKNYVPPTAASFGDDVNRTFSSSWTGLVNTSRKFALNTVSVVPWLPFWIVLAIVLYYPVRWLWRRLRDQSIRKEPAVTTA